jgi:DUF4097 and DUF4098 domain-containing protein YvlB
MRYQFPTQLPPTLRVGIAGGRVAIEAVETTETVVEVEAIRGALDNLRVEQHGGTIVVERRNLLGALFHDEFDVRIRVPLGTNADINTASANASTTGVLGKLEVNTASGAVDVERVERDARVRSASGAVTLGRIGGRVDVSTASGDVSVRAAQGGGTLRSASGDVVLGEAAKEVSVNTASGDQRIESIAEGAATLKSMSGHVKVGIKRGSQLRVDARSMSGRTTSEIELGAEASGVGPLVELRAGTMSGNIQIVRA